MISQKTCKSSKLQRTSNWQAGMSYVTRRKKLKFTASNFSSEQKLENSAYISTDLISDTWQQLCVVISKNKSLKKQKQKHKEQKTTDTRK